MTPHAAGQRGWGGGGLDVTLHKNNEQPIPRGCMNLRAPTAGIEG